MSLNDCPFCFKLSGSQRPKGRPSLRKGDEITSPLYIIASGYLPEGQFLVGSLMYDRIQELNLKPKGIGGLTMGADPIAVATSLTSHMRQNAIEAFSIRKEPKPHGLGLQLEGNVRENDKIIIIDDVVTTGKSTIQAINVARKHRLNIMCVIVLLDRCEENGKENIEKHGITVYPVLTIHDFI